MTEHIADQHVVVSTQETYSILTPTSIYVQSDADQDVAGVVFESNDGQVLQCEDVEEPQTMEMGEESIMADDRDDDLKDFMNVVTTYQCKLCEFGSTELSEFTNHVRSLHKKPRIESVLQVQVLEHPEVSQGDAAEINEEETPAFVFPPEGELNAECTQEQLSEQEDQGVIQVNENEVDYEINPANATMPVLTTESESVQDKELYVCATCGLAFSNIESCKDHMIQDHNVSLMEDLNAQTEAQSHQVSVGTQAVQTKRPGRKRNENRQPPSPTASVIVLSDEEGEELTDKVEVYETSNKRKVRPPRGLTQLYYISKQKTHTRACRTNSLTCPLNQCTASFNTQEALDLHLSCHIPPEKKNKKPWECPTCKTQFNQWKQIRMHLWNDHEQDTDLLKCSHCEFKTDTQQRLDAHEEMHTSYHSYKCQICSKLFKSRWMLRDHALVHSGKQKKGKKNSGDKSEKWFSGRQCHICNRTLANERCLNKHIEAVHNKDTIYQCPHCQYTAARKAMMQLHIRTHTGDKPFSCNQCDYKTADHNTLRRHIMRHTGTRPYKCQVCSYSAIQAISLKNHIKNRHPNGLGLYSCDQCNFVSINEVLYKNHLEDHKNGLVVPKVSLAQPTTVQGDQVIQVIRKGPLDDVGVLQSKLPASQMIYTAINALNQDALQEAANANNMGHTITLHMPNNEQSDMEVVSGIDDRQVVMIQEDGLTPQEGTVTYTTDGQIVHTLSQLSEEMMQAISASCSSGQQVTINIAGETGELIITTVDEGEAIDHEMGKSAMDFQTVEQQTISIEQATDVIQELPTESITQDSI